MSNPLLASYPHPGKFEGEINLTEKLYDISLDGGEDESIGDADTFGHYMLFTDLDKDTETFGDLGGIVAAILETSSQGFVTGHYYENEQEALQDFSRLSDDWQGVDLDDDPEPVTEYNVRFVAYCGMTFPLLTTEDAQEARDFAAKRLRSYRSEIGQDVSTLEKGQEWEVLDPEDAAMVSDYCGCLKLTKREISR